MPNTNGLTPLLQTLCYLCISDSTPPEKQGKHLHINCDKCGRCYCDKHASAFLPSFCDPCMSDIQVTKQDFVNAGVAVTHVVSENGEPVIDPLTGKQKIERKYYSTRSKQIILFGTDWLFTEIRLSELDELKAEQVLEYHRACISYLEQVITSHRIAKAHKLASVRVPVAQRNIVKTKERREKSLDALALSLGGNMKAEDLAKLIEKLQQSVGGVKK